MSITFQYNKIAKQSLEKQLKMRERALPTLRNKESALRLEVKRCRDKSQALHQQYSAAMQQYDSMMKLWCEFDMSIVRVKDIVLASRKIAGIETPVLSNIEFEIASFTLFTSPVWFTAGVHIIQQLATIGIEREVNERKLQLLEFARRKTTQKVNLFEKVQIPGFQDAILKIKRFLEDEENLSKSAQKIVKNRQTSNR